MYSVYRVLNDGTEVLVCKKATFNSARSFVRESEFQAHVNEFCWWFIVQGDRAVENPDVRSVFGPAFYSDFSEELEQQSEDATKWAFLEMAKKFPHRPGLYK